MGDTSVMYHLPQDKWCKHHSALSLASLGPSSRTYSQYLRLGGTFFTYSFPFTLEASFWTKKMLTTREVCRASETSSCRQETSNTHKWNRSACDSKGSWGLCLRVTRMCCPNTFKFIHTHTHTHSKQRKHQRTQCYAWRIVWRTNPGWDPSLWDF